MVYTSSMTSQLANIANGKMPAYKMWTLHHNKSAGSRHSVMTDGPPLTTQNSVTTRLDFIAVSFNTIILSRPRNHLGFVNPWHTIKYKKKYNHDELNNDC